MSDPHWDSYPDPLSSDELPRRAGWLVLAALFCAVVWVVGIWTVCQWLLF